ncbi:cobalt-precorrin-6A reductase [Pseudomonas sp. ABC1]|uniref:cobalt-precorrin-6A reductase n=1 Tax=Pseudomonas sp. ABC1 TaxID=2748080 RepID=UPI0015C3C5F5|nr:cobalt-precorrin-6A reductase [Pseudomonas sp. ABC1]QLF91828.1 cobalt-precorrin-6A reductase [Pseudomonas sp. ABC1]
MNILLLGGVGDALRLARRLPATAIYSLAGLGKVPGDLACRVRVGGFGGAEGLARFLHDKAIELLLDVTHPYAARISHNAALAARQCGIPCWALRRPGWRPGPGDDWRDVTNWSSLCSALAPFHRPFFTLGREPLEYLQTIPAGQFWTIRQLTPQAPHPRAHIIASRGPFELEQERELFKARRFDVLVSKNSGGQATEAKLQVARELGIPVLMLQRPDLPDVARVFEEMEALYQSLPISIRGS